MKNKALLLIFCLFTTVCLSQKYYTDLGITEFDGSKAAFEPIKAKNESSISILDFNNGKIAALIKISEFNFRLGLMQEHFNENYLESNIYPTSTFEGSIENFDKISLNDNFQEISIKGTLTIKGESNEILAVGFLKRNNNKIELKSSFSVKLSEYKIKIPRVVFKKIDEEVKINLNYVYEEKN
tara:strand:+ start:34 stop:582 length:549 start_codon:yes stop_codon:yes gene_type:complete